MNILRRDDGDTWSPYGHERARRALRQQRTALVIVAALVIAILYALFLQATLTEDNTAGGGRTEVKTPENKPVTVEVAPGGRPAFVNPNVAPPDSFDNTPQRQLEKEHALVTAAKPFLTLLAPLAMALFLLGRVGSGARGKLAELNFGVYKGAMPYELHTARAYKRVFTGRMVEEHVFGKQRTDFLWGSYLEDPPLSVQRLLGSVQVEDARVAKLRKGGTRITIRGPTARQKHQGGLEWAITRGREVLGLQTDDATRRRNQRLRRVRLQRRKEEVSRAYTSALGRLKKGSA